MLQEFKEMKPQWPILELGCDLASIDGPSIHRKMIPGGLEMEFEIVQGVKYTCKLLHHQNVSKFVISIGTVEMVDFTGDGYLNEAKGGDSLLPLVHDTYSFDNDRHAKFSNTMCPQGVIVTDKTKRENFEAWVTKFRKAISDIRVCVYAHQFRDVKDKTLTKWVYDGLSRPVVSVMGSSSGFILEEFGYDPLGNVVYQNTRTVKMTKQ